MKLALVADSDIAATVMTASCLPFSSRRGSGIGNAAHRIEVRAKLFGKTHDDVEAAVALENLPASLPPIAISTTSCTSRDVQAVAREPRAVDVHVSIGRPVVCSIFTSAAPGTAAAPSRSLPRLSQHVEIVAEDLDRESLRTPEMSSLNRIWIGCVNS